MFKNYDFCDAAKVKTWNLKWWLFLRFKQYLIMFFAKWADNILNYDLSENVRDRMKFEIWCGGYFRNVNTPTEQFLKI